MFVDVAQVKVKAGDGGNGALSFRHEKFIDRGGPDGGDGGKGGDVVFLASNNQNTLANFRYQKEITAQPGQPGSKRRKHGRNGSDLVVALPVGTSILAEDGTVLADLTEDNQKVIIAHGGKGGFGNAHFVSSTRQAPKVAEKGEAGQELAIRLELKMIADVGVIGLPNAGKSTLLSVISNAKPDIANYPFTTIVPNLGVVDIDKSTTLLFADIPGLIEGASKGKGLGDDFLRHVERNPVLVHLIDVYLEDVALAYKTIQKELKDYRIDLSRRPQLVALTKIDGLDAEIIDSVKAELQKVLPKKTRLLAISAQSGAGVKELLYEVKKLVNAEKSRIAKIEEKADSLPVLTIPTHDSWRISSTGSGFFVTGQKIESFAARTDFSSYHGLQRLRDIMRKMGIMHELKRQGIEPGDDIVIANHGKFEY